MSAKRARGGGTLGTQPSIPLRSWVLQYPAGRRGSPSPAAVGRQLAGVFALRGLDAAPGSLEDHVSDGRGRNVCAAAALEPRLTVRFVDAQESATLNQTFRGRPNATNVLSFPSGEPVAGAGAVAASESGPGGRLPWYLGDLVLCTDVLRAEAEAQGKSLLQHTAHLLVHGVLHLEGFDHLDDAQAQVMENEERRILDALGWPDPYATEAPDSTAGSDADPDAAARSVRRQPASPRWGAKQVSRDGVAS